MTNVKLKSVPFFSFSFPFCCLIFNLITTSVCVCVCVRLSSLSVCLVCPLTIQLSVLEEAAASQCCRCIVFPQCMATLTITVSSLSFIRQSVCFLTLTRCIEMRRLATRCILLLLFLLLAPGLSLKKNRPLLHHFQCSR